MGKEASGNSDSRLQEGCQPQRTFDEPFQCVILPKVEAALGSRKRPYYKEGTQTLLVKRGPPPPTNSLQELANFSCTGPDSKHLRLVGYLVSVVYSFSFHFLHLFENAKPFLACWLTKRWRVGFGPWTVVCKALNHITLFTSFIKPPTI